jgi:hypothetical protein
MKLATIGFLFLVLGSSLFAVGNHAAGRRVQIVGPVEDLNFGPLENTPNGHISFQKDPDEYRIWVPGRLNTGPNKHDEGGFLFEVPNWSSNVLGQAQPTFVLGHEVDELTPNCGPYVFDLNYAAMNAVVPGAGPGTSLAFYDAEYHAVCGEPEPLLSSIGLATSTDRGINWQKQGQIIQGLDEAIKGEACVTTRQANEFNNHNHILDVGASGPSVVVREDDGAVYLYLYYADRTPITGGPDSIYLARALLTSDGMPGNWQKWTGESWGIVGDQTSAVPVVAPPPDGAYLQPHVSWNTALRSWLMVLKTGFDFEVTTSADGVHWDLPVSLMPFDEKDNKTAFPTLISLNGGDGDESGSVEGSDQNPWSLLHSRREASQQVTGAIGWLYYSSLPMHQKQYIGHRKPFRISAD